MPDIADYTEASTTKAELTAEQRRARAEKEYDRLKAMFHEINVATLGKKVVQVLEDIADTPGRKNREALIKDYLENIEDSTIRGKAAKAYRQYREARRGFVRNTEGEIIRTEFFLENHLAALRKSGVTTKEVVEEISRVVKELEVVRKGE